MNTLNKTINHSVIVIAWIILVLLNIFDVSITYLGVSVLQITEEVNPLFSEINNGNYFTIILYKIICLSILFPFRIYTRSITYIALILAASFIYYLLGMYHLVILFKYFLST